MNQEFAEEKEANGFAKLQDFNSFLKLIELGQTPPKHWSDASGITTDGRYLNFELKIRNQTLDMQNMIVSGINSTNKNVYTANTIYIEMHKLGSLLLDYTVLDYEPLYVNFLSNAIVVYNLSKLHKVPNTIARRIYSTLFQGFEMAKRVELPLEEAYIYIKDENNEYKLVYKPR